MGRQRPIKESKFVDSKNFDAKQHIRMVDRDLTHLFDSVQYFHPPYGCMHVNNGALIVAVTDTDTFVQISSGLLSDTSKEVTFQNGRELKIKSGGIYHLVWSLSVQTGSANQEVEGVAMVDATAVTSMTAHTNLITANRPLNITASGIVSLLKDKLVSLAVSNHTAANNIQVEHASLTVHRIA